MKKIIQTTMVTAFSFCCLLLCIPTAQAEMKVSQSLSKYEIPFEDSVQFQIIVEWEGSQSDYLFHKPLSPYIDRLKIGKFSSSISSLQRDGAEITQKKYNYTLLPTSAGQGLIDSISIAYVKRGDTVPSFVVTEPMTLTIATPKPKVNKDEGVKTSYIYGGIILLFIIGAIVVVRLKNSKKDVVVVTPKDAFLDMLTNVKNESNSDLKKFQTEFFGIMHRYLVDAYNVDVSQVKTENLLDELAKSGMSMKNAEQITSWMKQAEIDKYAPASTSPGAVVRLESEIRTFFEKI